MSEITTEALRKRATELGIKFTSKTSDDALLAKIEEAEKDQARVEAIKDGRENAALIRVKVIPVNPTEAKTNSKFFWLANRYVDFRKAVQFNTPIFLPKAVVEMLKNEKYLQVASNITASGTAKSEPAKTLVPAYSIVELPMPTKEELEAMKKDKAMRNASIKDGD